MLRRLVLLFAMIVILGYPAYTIGRELPRLDELKQRQPLEIEGAKVSTENEASEIAMKAYFHKAGGILALEGHGVPSIITLGFDIPDFGEKGDKVWEVRFHHMFWELRAILWVHSETEEVYFVIGHWIENSKEK